MIHNDTDQNSLSGLSPYALAYHSGIIYWIDLAGDKGSIKSAPALPNATATTLSSKLGKPSG